MASANKNQPSKQSEWEGEGVYNMGEHTIVVPMSLHKENRDKLCSRLRNAGVPQGRIVLLQGGTDYFVGSSDANPIFRQEAYFHWAFGVLEPDWFGAIEVDSGRAILFCPRLHQDYAKWMGRISIPEEHKRRYQVHRVNYVDEIAQVLKDLKPSTLLTLHGTDSDSGQDTTEAAFEGISQFTVDNKFLHDHMAECRVTKNQEEIRVLRYAAQITSEAHIDVMKKIRPGMREYQLESLFQHYGYYNGGCRHQGYSNICGSGCNSAILHYGHAGAPNTRLVQDGDMCLFDMGCEYYRYTADITCSFPANGKFTEDQKLIYSAVLAASRAVMEAARPGVSYVDLHALAYRSLLEKLLQGGLLKGNVDDMMKANIGAVFQPHGLGHLLGINVHDVGGYLPHCPPRPTEEGFKSLRFARNLEENMVITIEPGCYFIDYLLDAALANPEQEGFFNKEMLARFRGTGGVRIEDDVLVISDGIENLTQVPRTVEQIESLMAEGRQEEVFVPQLRLKEKLQN